MLRVTRISARFVLMLALSGAALGLGCSHDKKAAEAEAPPPPKPKNAADIARKIVNARVGMMVWAERFRGHPVEMRLNALNPMRTTLEAAGIDLARDAYAAYIASTGVTTSDLSAVIVEHKLDGAKVQAGLDLLIARSQPPGAWINGAPVPSARVTVRGQTRVVSIVEPNFLVVLPESIAAQASRFVGTGGFPDPEGLDAVVITAEDPAHSLAAANVPRVPATIRSIEARVFLAPDGGVDIAAKGESTDPMQAENDARYLTDVIDRSTSLNLGFVKVRLFSPVVFRPEGSQVKARQHLTTAEIDRLLTIADTLMPR